MIKRGDKKGFEMSINVLIVIVLALLVLAALIIAFTTGFSQFWKIIKGYFMSDVSGIKQACETACTAGNSYDYCCVSRDADFGNGKEKITCQDLRLKLNCNLNCEDAC